MAAASIFESHDHTFTVVCVRQLFSDVHVPMTEMQNLRLALELAIQNPSDLLRGAPETTTLAQPAEVQQVQAQVESELFASGSPHERSSPVITKSKSYGAPLRGGIKQGGPLRGQ